MWVSVLGGVVRETDVDIEEGIVCYREGTFEILPLDLK